jgi:hypothetical protein
MPPRPVKLKYHQATFLLLDEKPIISARAVKEIDRWEKRSGLKLPAALKEWYSLEGAEEWLQRIQKRFVAVPLRSLFKGLENPWGPPGGPLLLRIGQLDFVAYFTRIVRSADPPVLMVWDSMDIDQDRFSIFVFRAIWGGLNGADFIKNEEGGNLSSPKDTCGPMEFDFLQEHYYLGLHEVFEHHQGVNPFTKKLIDVYRLRKKRGKRSSEETSGPDRHDYHFFLPGKRIMVRCFGDPTTGERPASWTIGADSSEKLRDVTQHIWLCGQLSRTLKARDKSGKALLRELRRMMGQK